MWFLTSEDLKEDQTPHTLLEFFALNTFGNVNVLGLERSGAGPALPEGAQSPLCRGEPRGDPRERGGGFEPLSPVTAGSWRPPS